MASNTLGESTRLVYHDLAPALSPNDGASFAIGRCVLVRIPGRIQVEEHVEDEATAVGTGLPPTSNGTSPQHFAFIREMEFLSDGSYALEVYPHRFFHSHLCHSVTPRLMLLNFGTWRNSRDSFLLVNPRRFIMPTSRPFKKMDPPLIMPTSVLYRIKRYRDTLHSFTQSTNTHNRDDYSTLLVLEGVDEDADGPDATELDQLMMLAYNDPVWKEELRRHLQKEEEERERMQKERAARLARWREDVVFFSQPENEIEVWASTIHVIPLQKV